MKRILNAMLVGTLAVVLGACASSSPDVIQRGDAQRMAKVEDLVGLTSMGTW